MQRIIRIVKVTMDNSTTSASKNDKKNTPCYEILRGGDLVIVPTSPDKDKDDNYFLVISNVLVRLVSKGDKVNLV